MDQAWRGKKKNTRMGSGLFVFIFCELSSDTSFFSALYFACVMKTINIHVFRNK